MSLVKHGAFLATEELAEKSNLALLDCTLREGSYAVDFQFDEGFVTRLLARLNETPMPMIEIGHGIGLEAELAGIKAGNIDHFRWCELANETLTKKPWGMFAQPEFTRLSTLAEMTARGMSFVRVGMEPDRVQANLDYLKRAIEICPAVYLNLMKSSATPLDDFRAMLDGVPDGIAGVYVVDSYGAMLPADVQRYVTAACEMFSTVGFHGHDNLGLATVNSICAWQSGAAIVDGTLDGIGRGSGNAPVEALAGIVNVLEGDLFDYREIAKLAQFARSNLDVIVDNRMMQVLGGVIGIHSGYFPLVERLAERCGTEPAHLMETAVRLAEQSARPADIQAAADKIAAGGPWRSSEKDTLLLDQQRMPVDRDDVAGTDAVTLSKIAV